MLDSQQANALIGVTLALLFCIGSFFGGRWWGIEELKKDDPYKAMPSQQATLLKGIAMLNTDPMAQVLIQEAVSKSSPCVADPKSAVAKRKKQEGGV